MDESQFSISTVDDSICDSLAQGLRRKLEDDFETPIKEKRQKTTTAGAATGKDHMKVFLRVRPFTSEEEEEKQNQGCMGIEDANTLNARAPEGSNTFKNSQHGCGKQTHKFTFSKIFGEKTTQKIFFDETVLSTVKDFIDGQNCLVFTYGVTNSGKTYTIQGHPQDGGILPRALDVLFNSISGQQWESNSLKPSMFCDVALLSEAQQENETKIKERVLALALDDENDVTVSSMVSDSDSSRLTIGSRMSEDSLNIDSGHGSENPESSDKDKSAIDKLFKEAEQRVRDEAAVNVTSQGQILFSVWVTFIEIYNEYIYDLLEPLPKKKTVRRPTFTLREDRNGVPYVKGVKEIHVTSADEAYKVLMIGKQNLQFACTKLNHNSSRSHCIFTIKVLRVVDTANPSVARVSMLSFCDLAGAERYSKTHSTGDRVKEAGNINTSLLSLGRCIKILRHNQTNREHQQLVPFRDSKLTRLFQSFFCGKGKASMIVNINQCANMFDETLHALKYSAIARQVVVVQEAPKAPTQPARERGPRSHRYVSLALAEAANADPTRPRPTIGFATPGTLSRILQEEEDAETPKAYQPEGEQSQDAVLLDIIEILKEELVKEKNEKEMLEWNIRNEVCQEMQQQLVTIEKEHETQMRHMKDRLEDRADSKVNILLQSMKKKKRRRDDDEDDIDETELLKVASEEKDLKIELLESRVEELQSQLTKCNRKPDVHTPTMTPTKQIDQLAVIEQMQDKLNDAKAQLEAKDSEIAELGEMLSEAGETFHQKTAEIENMQSEFEKYKQRLQEQEDRYAEVQKLLEEAQKAKAESIEQLCLMDKNVASLTAQLEAANSKDCSSCQEQVVRLGDVVSKLADTEAEVDKINHDFVSLQKEVSNKNDEVRRLEEQLNKKDQDVKELRENLKKGNEADSHVSKLVAQLEALEKELGTKSLESTALEKERVVLQDGKAELEVKLSKLQETIDEHQGALRDHETFVAELNKQLKDANTSVEEVKDERNTMKRKISKLEENIKTQEEELFQVQERLSTQEEENTKLSEELDVKEKKLQEGGRKSFQQENKVDALEQSLQQANSALRETSLEAAQLKEQFQEVTQFKMDLEEKQVEAKRQITDLHSQLEDYVLKVNEQAEEVGDLGDKLKSVEDTSKGLREKLTDAEGKVVEKDGELSNLRNKVEDYETRLNAERKQQKSANTELDDLLQTKAILIEELNSNVTTVTNKLNEKIKQLEQQSTKVTDLQTKLEQTTEELKVSKTQLKDTKLSENKISSEVKDSENQIKQLEDKIKKLELELSSARSNEAKTKEDLAGVNNKVEGLQLSLEMAQEDAKDVIEVKVSLEKANKELEKKKSVIEKLKKDLESAKSSAKEKEKEESTEQHSQEENVEKLERRIRQLEGEVSEAQYSTQMNSRMLRREKSQVENRLKEAEDELEKVRGNALKLQGQLASEKLANQSKGPADGEDNDLEKKLDESRKKADRLEGAIEDLEICLKSAKSSQQSALDTAEEYKKKCRGIEDEMSAKEDRLHFLEGEMKIKEEKEELLKVREKEIDELNEVLCDLEHKCKEYRVGMENMESRLSYVGVLEEKNESILSELDQHEEKINALNEDLEKAQLHIKDLEGQVLDAEEKDATASSLKKDIEKLRSDYEIEIDSLKTKISDQTNEIDALQIKLSDQESLFKESSAHKETLESENKEIKLKEKELSQAIETKNSELEKTIKSKTALEDELKLLKNSRSVLENTISEKSITLESENKELKLKGEELSQEIETKNLELEKTIKSKTALEDELKLLKNSCSVLENTISEKSTENKELKVKGDELSQEVATKNLDLEKAIKSKTALEDELKLLKNSCNVLEKTVGEKSITLETLQKSIADDKETLKGKNEDLKNKEASLRKELEQKEENLSALKEDTTSLKRDVKRLTRQIDVLTADKEEATITIKSLRLEVDVKDKKITSVEEEVKKAKANVDVVEDLEKANRREKQLRTQLAEASARQEEQNQKFNTLENKLRRAQEDAEIHETETKASKNTINDLKDKLAQVEKQLSLSKDECESLDSRLSQERSSMDLKIKQFEEDIGKKEGKLKARSATITDLMSKVELERNSYEISLQDARANEAVLDQLKKALEDQDATIELQEKALGQKEDEIAAAQKDYDTLMDKYNALISETGSQSSSVRSLTTQLKKLREQRTQAELEMNQAQEESRSLKATLNQNNKDRSQMRRDLEETNRELREMEKMQSESRKEIDALKQRLAEIKESRKKSPEPPSNNPGKEDQQKLALLKTKFAALENDNKKLDEEVDRMKKIVESTEQEKVVELKKWRDDRDKIVSQLEIILKQKDAQIVEMKKVSGSSSKTDHELQNRIDQLEEELMDKNATIAELSKHLSDTGTSRSLRKKGKSISEDDSTMHTMKKEVEDMRRQFEADRQDHSKEIARVVRAKDAIINDLRDTNILLQSRFPGGSQTPLARQHAQEANVEMAAIKEERSSSESHEVKAPPRRSSRKSRVKKRKSNVEEDSEKSTPSGNRRKPSHKQAAQVQVSMDENQDDEGSSGGEKAMVTITPAKRVALTDMNTTPAEYLTSFISPSKSAKKREPQSEKSARRVRLRTTLAEPFAESPPLELAPTPVKDHSHDTVTRQLRTRRKCSKV